MSSGHSSDVKVAPRATLLSGGWHVTRATEKWSTGGSSKANEAESGQGRPWRRKAGGAGKG